MFQSFPVIPLWETWRWPAASRRSSTWSSTTILSCWVSEDLSQLLRCGPRDSWKYFCNFPHWHPCHMSFVFCFEPVIGRRGSDARSKLDDISVSEGTQVHKKILAMFGAGSRNLLPLYLVYQFTMDEGLELFFLWDRNRNTIWSQWEERKEHPWNDGFGGVVVTHSFRPAGLGTERRVKLTHGGFYGCGTIRHPSISIYRPPKQKLGKSSCMFDV